MSLVAITAFGSIALAEPVKLTHDRSNIIYINADDLGVMDVGYNSSRYQTPKIDRLRPSLKLLSSPVGNTGIDVWQYH